MAPKRFCDNCEEELKGMAYVCRGYVFLACSTGCLANLMLIIERVDVEKFIEEEGI